MSEKLPSAICGAEDRPLNLGGFQIPCYVLEDGKRVLIQGGVIRALDMKQGTAGRGGGDRLAKFISTKGINPFVSEELAAMIKNPIKFRTTKGALAYGYEATILADLCDAVLDARKDGKLHYQQVHIADQCEILVRGFARVGIIALVDEATGYQETRDKDALRAILDAYLRKELAAWAKRFPDDFYKEMFRLRNWQWKGMSVNRPSIVGHYTNDLIYERLAPNILNELESKNPKNETTGRRKSKHHQWLTDDVGHPALAQHLHAIIGFMRASTTWAQFYRLVQRAFPKRGSQLVLPMDID